MPIPLIPVGASILWGATAMALLRKVLLWVLIAKGAAIIARTMGVLGLAWFTYEWILAPAIAMADTYIGALPSELVIWMRAFGTLEVASIIVSAYVLWGAKKMFLGKTA